MEFGTDGWRGVIGATFRRENVERVARAYALSRLRQGTSDRGVVVGFDARFLSDRAAQWIAQVLSEAGIPVVLSDRICPTPAVSHAVVAKNAAGGLMVTASHNPPEYNGIKFKSVEGGSALPEEVAAIADCLDHAEALPNASAPWRRQDLLGLYADRLRLCTPPPAGGRTLALVVDPMHGATAGVAAELLRARGHRVQEIRNTRDVLFGGVFPEPIPPHIGRLGEAVRAAGADLGLATDGDGDRIGAVTADGRFFNPHQIFALLALWLLENGERGRIVKTVSTTVLLDRIGAEFGVPITVTPIGFKHVYNEIRRGDVLIGGEESGGLWVQGAIPERDGVRAALLLTDVVAQGSQPLHVLWSQISKRFGSFAYRRRDRAVPRRWKEAVEEAAAQLDRVDGVPVRAVDTQDGVKLICENDWWLMFRFSGTEPLLRLYAETESPNRCERFLDVAEQLVQRVTGQSFSA